MELIAFARPPKKPPNNFVRLAAIPFALLVLVLVWLAPTVAVDTPGHNYLPATDRLQSVVENTLPSLKVHRYRDDFRKGLADWNHGGRSASDWNYEAGAVHPGKLRLWKRSLDMTDYQFEFQAVIEQKAVSWAFRASDVNNYYATKITLGRGDGSSGTRIVRYVVMNGVQKDRTLLPSPVELKAQEPYRIRVSVKGDAFSTLVNDQLVDQWKDARLAGGGIGFFAEQGEVASVQWVSIADRETFFSRLFASTLLLTPAASRALPPIE